MMLRANGRRTVPQIFIGEAHVGGSDDIHELDRRGQLDPCSSRTVIRAALIQMRSGRDMARNAADAAEMIRDARPTAPISSRRRR